MLLSTFGPSSKFVFDWPLNNKKCILWELLMTLSTSLIGFKGHFCPFMFEPSGPATKTIWASFYHQLHLFLLPKKKEKLGFCCTYNIGNNKVEDAKIKSNTSNMWLRIEYHCEIVMDSTESRSKICGMPACLGNR